MTKKFIAYQGEEFTVEWYFNNLGNSNALDYFLKLTENQKNKTFYLIQKLAETGKIFNKEKFTYEGDQIFAIKPSPDRFLCFFFEGSKIIITNAYKKQSQKMPFREKEQALKAKFDYNKRYKEGTYYD
jgi:phage-related protein